MGLLRWSSFLLFVLAATQLSAQLSPPLPSENAIQGDARQILDLANQARAAQGAAPLRWDAALAAAARQHCLRMVAEGQIEHRYGGEQDLSNRAAQAGAHFDLIEENIAVAPTPTTIHSEWMHSPGHRSNLLNPDVDHVGIAVVAGRRGLYVVADYERAVEVLNREQVEATVVKLLRAQRITVFTDPSDARAYCANGSRERSYFAMLWQGASLTELPGELQKSIASGKYHQASVGNCPSQELEGPFTAYRVAVLLR